MSASITKPPGRVGDGVALTSVAHPNVAWRITKRSVRVGQRRTSISVENAFWWALKNIARRRGMSIDALVCELDMSRHGNLSSAVRLAVLVDVQERLFPAPALLGRK